MIYSGATWSFGTGVGSAPPKLCDSQREKCKNPKFSKKEIGMPLWKEEESQEIHNRLSSLGLVSLPTPFLIPSCSKFSYLPGFALARTPPPPDLCTAASFYCAFQISALTAPAQGGLLRPPLWGADSDVRALACRLIDLLEAQLLITLFTFVLLSPECELYASRNFYLFYSLLNPQGWE